MKFFIEAKRNRSMLALSKAHCHYAAQDPEQVEELFRTVDVGLTENDYEALRPFLFLLEVLLETKHEAFTSRRAAWLARFLDIVKSNGRFYKWTEVVYEFIFKIVGRNAFVREWFYSNPDTWNHLVQWVGNNPRAPHPAQPTATGVRLFKGSHNMQLAALQSFNDPATAARTSLSAAYRVRKLHEMLQKTVPDVS